MLLSDCCELSGLDESDTLSVVVADDQWELISIVGFPEKRAIEEAAEKSPGKAVILATPESCEHVSKALPGWTISPARLHLLGENTHLPSISDKEVRLITSSELEEMTILPPDLKEELVEASEYSPVSAAFADNNPVSFCYAGSQTESLWDISIDTLEEFRNRGFASTAVAYLIEHMSRQDKQPVWGAEEINVASMKLAAKLGFVVVDRIMVFQRADKN